MLAGGDLHGKRLRHPQPENVLRIVRYARRIAMPPYRIDFVDVLQVPVGKLVAPGFEPRFFANFADGGLPQALALVLATRHRLPEPRMVRSLEEEHLERGRMDHDQRRHRNLGCAQARIRETISPVPSKNAWGMSRVRCAATVAPSRSTAMNPTSASNCFPSRPSIARIASASVAPCSTASEIVRVASVRSTNSPVPVAEAATWADA